MTAAVVSLALGMVAAVGGLISGAVLIHQWARRAATAEVNEVKEQSAHEIAAERYNAARDALDKSEAARLDETDRYERSLDEFEAQINDLEKRVLLGPPADVVRRVIGQGRANAAAARRLSFKVVPLAAASSDGRSGTDANGAPDRGTVSEPVGSVSE